MEPDVLETFLKEKIEIDDEFVERIMSFATSEGIIRNRLNECFDKSIAKNHKKLKKFLDLNKKTKESDLLHIITILQLLLDKLKLDEVDRVDEFDDYEKRFIYSIMVQFIDPCSVLMGISMCDEDSRFDFFKEWMTYIYPTIDADIEISQDGGYKKTKKRKKSRKKKSRKKKKSSKKKRSKKKSKRNKSKKIKGKTRKGGGKEDSGSTKTYRAQDMPVWWQQLQDMKGTTTNELNPDGSEDCEAYRQCHRRAALTKVGHQLDEEMNRCETYNCNEIEKDKIISTEHHAAERALARAGHK